MRIVIVALAATLFTTPAIAQNICSRYVGTVVTPRTFDQALTSFTAMSPKGEFETTSAYQARIARATSSIPYPLIIAKEIESLEDITYDADSAMLRIQTYAIDNKGMDWSGAFGVAKPMGIRAGYMYNIASVLSQVDKPVGTSEAQNAYGAKTTIIKVERTTNAIFSSEARSFDEGIFGKRENGHLGSIAMPPATAQLVKSKLRAAWVVRPKPPFLVQGVLRGRTPTIRNPFDVTENFRILIADFQCGLIMDGTNKVLAAFQAVGAYDAPVAVAGGFEEP